MSPYPVQGASQVGASQKKTNKPNQKALDKQLSELCSRCVLSQEEMFEWHERIWLAQVKVN